MTDRVDSIKDERIALARSLGTRAGRLVAGRCLIEGAPLIRQVVAADGLVEYALCPEGDEDLDTRAELTAAGVPVFAVRAGLLAKLIGPRRPVQWLCGGEAAG